MRKRLAPLFLPRCEATAGGAERGTREAEGAIAAKRRALRAPLRRPRFARAPPFAALTGEEKGVAARAGNDTKEMLAAGRAFGSGGKRCGKRGDDEIGQHQRGKAY